MFFRRASIVVLLGYLSTTHSVLGGQVQKSDLTLPNDAAIHRAAVENIFLESYAAYKLGFDDIWMFYYALMGDVLFSDCCRKYAWGHDDLTPVSKSFTDGRNGWGATIVDALTTLVKSIARQA